MLIEFSQVFVECGSLMCGQSPSDLYQPHLIDGVLAPEAKFPWTVGLYKDGKIFCAGTLINQNWILTSAGCVAGKEGDYIVARLGASRRGSLNGNEQQIPVNLILTNPNYQLSKNPQVLSVDGDLALLHLERTAKWNTNIKPVCLPTTKALPEEVVVNGWSKTIGKNKIFTGEHGLFARDPPKVHKSGSFFQRAL